MLGVNTISIHLSMYLSNKTKTGVLVLEINLQKRLSTEISLDLCLGNARAVTKGEYAQSIYPLIGNRWYLLV